MQKLLRRHFKKCFDCRLGHVTNGRLATATQDEGFACDDCQWEGGTPETHLGASVKG